MDRPCLKTAHYNIGTLSLYLLTYCNGGDSTNTHKDCRRTA